LGISRFPFGSLETKCHLDVGLMERHKVYYKGEVSGFPQVRAMVNLMNLNLPVAHPSTKWRTPKSRGETHLRVSQSQVAES
jgi:hypothetical protein